MFALGVIYYSGEAGLEKDVEVAVQWWAAGADHRCAGCLFNLAQA
jgi:TPR repeat protein